MLGWIPDGRNHQRAELLLRWARAPRQPGGSWYPRASSLQWPRQRRLVLRNDAEHEAQVFATKGRCSGELERKVGKQRISQHLRWTPDPTPPGRC